MTDASIIFVFAGVIAVSFLIIFLLKRKKRAVRTQSTCGTTPNPGGTLNPLAWYIGPKFEHAPTKGSIGMPDHPSPNVTGGWYFDFPVGVNLPLQTGSKVGYLTFNHGPLSGRREIRMRYKLDLADGAHVLAVPEQDPLGIWMAQITMYFQREGDDWTGAGKFGGYRWWASKHAQRLQAGEHEIIVSLAPNGWSSVNPDNNIGGFTEAINDACCVGFVFGGNEISFGHGARATGPARFTLLEFTVS